MNPLSSETDEPEEPSVKIPLPYASGTQSVYSYSKKTRDGVVGSSSSSLSGQREELSDIELTEPIKES